MAPKLILRSEHGGNLETERQTSGVARQRESMPRQCLPAPHIYCTGLRRKTAVEVSFNQPLIHSFGEGFGLKTSFVGGDCSIPSILLFLPGREPLDGTNEATGKSRTPTPAPRGIHVNQRGAFVQGNGSLDPRGRMMTNPIPRGLLRYRYRAASVGWAAPT